MCFWYALHTHIYVPEVLFIKEKSMILQIRRTYHSNFKHRIIGHNNFNCRNSNLASTSFHNLAREQARPKRTALVGKKTATLLPFFLLVDSQG